VSAEPPVSDAVEYAQLEPTAGFDALPGGPAAPAGEPAGGLDRLREVPVELTCEIGRTSMTIGEALALAPGSIVSLNRLAGEPVDLLVNGKPIARGEVVVIDEEFGLRVTEINHSV
jgi:flagellar motor switch protein FliN